MKKYITLLILTFVVLFSGLPAGVLAAEEANGAIEGVLVNRTAGSTSSVADVEITLKTYLDEADQQKDALAKTDANGKFSFNKLQTASKYSYQMTVTYLKAEYTSETIIFGDSETTKTFEFTVYDSTTSDEAIKVANAHSIIYAVSGGIMVKEVLFIDNQSDLSLVGIGDDKRTLRFSIPSGATNLEYGLDLMSCCVINSEEGIADTMSIPPGIRQIAYSYQVTAKKGTYDFVFKPLYPTDNYDFLVQNDGIQVSTDRLVPQDVVTLENMDFNHYVAQDIKDGEAITVRLGNLPKGSSTTSTVKWLAGFLVVLGGGFGLVYTMRKRKPQPVPVSSGSAASIAPRKQKLLEEIAGLDDSFENGEIAEEDYRRLRAVKKTQIIELMQKSGNKRK